MTPAVVWEVVRQGGCLGSRVARHLDDFMVISKDSPHYGHRTQVFLHPRSMHLPSPTYVLSSYRYFIRHGYKVEPLWIVRGSTLPKVMPPGDFDEPIPTFSGLPLTRLSSRSSWGIPQIHTYLIVGKTNAARPNVPVFFVAA